MLQSRLNRNRPTPSEVAGLVLRILTVAALFTGPATAAEPEPDYINFGAGSFNVLDQKRSTVFHGEYRFGKKLWHVRPFVGIMGTTDRAFYGYGGFGLDINLTDRIVLRPSLAMGIYVRGDGILLGFPLEFRSDIELAYTFDDRSRVGVSFFHISNASLSSDNPGTEILRISYSVPLKPLF